MRVRKYNMLVFLVFLCNVLAYAQFSDSFNSGLSQWEGDINNLVINTDNQLQLNASESGESTIYAAASFPNEWVFTSYIKLDFSPSSNNRLRWYFYAETSDLNNSNAYFFEFGENGSNDAITLYERKNGQEIEIGRGKNAGIATDPVEIRIEIEVLKDQPLKVKVDYDGGLLTTIDFEAMLEEDFNSSGFLGYHFKYTTSRISSFILDDIDLKVFTEDKEAPVLSVVSVSGINIIDLIFNEALDPITSNTPQNYQVNGSTPTSVSTDGNLVKLTFASLPEEIFTLNISNISDQKGNVISPINVPDLYVSFPPSAGDLIITEILFNPKGSDPDYIELYNNSSKILSLLTMAIHNNDNGQIDLIDNSFDIFPGEYVAITENVEAIENRYLPPSDAIIIENKLPSFNNDEGNIRLIYIAEVIDEFDYNEDFHTQVLNDLDGVSLERISLTSPTNFFSNWTSASQASSFGTPGYKNSAFIAPTTSEDQLSLREKTFSPDGDGNKELMILDYKLDKSNYVANVKIYNDQGFLIRDLYNNQGLSSSGFLAWDGRDNNGSIARIGIYIVYVQLFHEDGQTLNQRLPTVLSGRLD